MTMLRGALAFLLAITFSAPAFAQSDRPVLVAAGDARLDTEVSGLQDRVPGTPVVIFENGFATPYENWAGVAKEMAGFAPVVQYNRAGVGTSQAASAPPTIANSVARLKALLVSLEIAPPYVLVGHSWGGLLVREFALAYPDDVAGLVLVDPTDPATTEDMDRQLFIDAGAGEDGVDQFYAILMSSFANAPAGIAAELAVMNEFRQNTPGLRERDTLPAIPVTVLLGGKLSIPPQMGEAMGMDIARYGELSLQMRMSHFLDLTRASPDGLLVVAPQAGHFVHQDDTPLVVENIRRIVELATQQPEGSREGSE